MTGLTWEAGFDAGWEACEKSNLEKTEILLAERNAARSEVDRLRAELKSYQEAAERRKAVLRLVDGGEG